MTTRQLPATSPAVTAAAPKPSKPPRVRHRVTGDIGVLDHIQRCQWGDWARVRWDPGISSWSSSGQPPGMTDADGLAYIAPGLLTYLGTGQRVGQ